MDDKKRVSPSHPAPSSKRLAVPRDPRSPIHPSNFLFSQSGCSREDKTQESGVDDPKKKKTKKKTDLEGNVVAANTDFELLFSDDVRFWPV